MGKMTLSIFSAMLLSLSTLAAQAYCNNRFGFCLEYPAGFRLIDDGPINADGATLEAANGIRISVSGSFNVLEWKPEKIYEFTKEDFAAQAKAVVTELDAATTATGFEALLAAGESCQYARMLSKGDVFLLLTITGPEALLEDMKKLKEQLKLSFAGENSRR